MDDPKWVQKAKRNEEKNEKMNLMSKSQKTSNPASRAGYDKIKWGPEVMVAQVEWYGYLHVEGGLFLKRYFGDPLDIQEAIESDFVSRVIGPFKARSREEALKILNKEF